MRPYTVAPKSKLACSRVSGETNACSQVFPQTSLPKAPGSKCPVRQTFAHSAANASNLGLGTYLGDFTARGLWSIPESKSHINFLEYEPFFWP